MVHDDIFARSFSRNEQKRFGNCAFVMCIFVAFTLCIVFRPNFHLSILNLEVATSRGLDMVILSSPQVEQQVISRKDGKMTPEPLNAPSPVDHTKTSSSASQPFGKPASNPHSRSRNDSLIKASHDLSNSIDCRFSEAASDYCEIKGMIRIDGHSSTIFTSNLAGNKSWVIRPYARKGTDVMKWVREWTIKGVEGRDHMPSCTMTHSDPIILFSTGGFSGNHFHAFSDILIPLFTSSRVFNRKVHLLVTDYKRWWVSKFRGLLNQLSYHQVMDVDSEDRVHCYQHAIIGLRLHKELGIDTSRSPNATSMKDFRDFLRSTYSLERRVAINLKSGNNRRPRLMIISRKSTRKLTNEARIMKMAQRIGYEVVMGNVTHSTNLSSFARVVNSCDVFMGVHGAGLTNMVFLPDNAVVVQVVPLGGIEGIAKMDFGEPSKEMKLRYLNYSIRVKESSLATQYAADDVVLRDPTVIHRQGWGALRTTYLEKQNVKLDVRRFRSTLLKALKLLHH